MNAGVLVFAALFAFAGYREAQRFQRQYGNTPWGWDAWVWSVVLFLSWVIGIVLLAIAERQGRNKAASRRSYAPQVAATPTYAMAGAIAGASAYSPGVAPGAVSAAVPAAVAAPVSTLPPACWAADPTGRHQYRWWDGATWTTNVHDNGINGQDPL